MEDYEVCRQLRADGLTRGIPVIFVSGHTTEEERERVLALGAAGILAKLVEPEILYGSIERALGYPGEEQPGG